MPGAPTPNLDLPVPDLGPPPLPAAPDRRRPTTLLPVPEIPALAPGVQVGDWRIEGELGRGGMATVYAVVHTRFDKRAALKLAHSSILGPQFTPEIFLREARIASLIDHPGIAEVFATGSYGDRPYLAIEHLQGRALGARLHRGGLPRDAAIELLLELCDVLEAAHAAGVIHGDLKVDNVFVLDQPTADGRRTKLLDWGIARIAGEDDPLRGLIAGTLTYVAPEHIRGDDLTPAADVYSLGVLGYLLLLGEFPFASTRELDLLRKHLREKPPRPRTRWPEIPSELEATLIAMLAKQPHARPSLREVARALHSARRRLQAPRRGWLGAPAERPAELPADVIGRPVLARFPTRAQRLAGAALGLALIIASLCRLL